MVDVVAGGGAVVVVVVAGVVGGLVTGGTVAGGLVTVVAGVVVVVAGTTVSVTFWMGTVVADAPVVVDATPVPLTGPAGAAGAIGPGTVLDEVELVPKRSDVPPAVKRLPTSVVDVVAAVTWGLAADARGVWRAPSSAVAAIMRVTTATPTPAASTPLTRAVLLWAYHHDRSRSRADGRPNAVRLPMYEWKR